MVDIFEVHAHPVVEARHVVSADFIHTSVARPTFESLGKRPMLVSEPLRNLP
jgi:hypothetical protein